jgi:hypothetical protein
MLLNTQVPVYFERYLAQWNRTSESLMYRVGSYMYLLYGLEERKRDWKVFCLALRAIAPPSTRNSSLLLVDSSKAANKESQEVRNAHSHSPHHLLICLPAAYLPINPNGTNYIPFTLTTLNHSRSRPFRFFLPPKTNPRERRAREEKSRNLEELIIIIIKYFWVGSRPSLAFRPKNKN